MSKFVDSCDLSYPHKLLHKVPANLNHFWVITVLSNPSRYKKRYELYWRFAEMCKAAGINLITVELALGARSFMVTERDNPHHVQLRTNDELWHKENMQNIGTIVASQLDPEIREVAYIDCDLRPMCEPRHWFEETWQELQHFEAVQMFEYLIDLDTDNNPLSGPKPSFMGSYMKGNTLLTADGGADSYNPHGKHWLGAPGGAWAWNVSALKKVGGLIDFCILGSADWHMAQGLLGALEPMSNEAWSKPYSKRLYEWQERAVRWIRKDIGVVRGGVLHDNHGPKELRFYVDRKQILTENEYDPNIDIKYDHQGLIQLETYTARQIALRDGIRSYHRARMEDTPEYKKADYKIPLTRPKL